ncbi:MAG: ATP-binding cassette domain-containing protein, partial [Christensenellaceae bacterium]|nr:ATP-binding cassette domain-containing protein [Christensenellaceae bacterium]
MLRLDTLSKYYVTGTQVITGIKSISASFVLGEFVIITGASGSGKTTLLNVIAGSDNYNDGVMIVEDENTEYFGDEDWERYRKEIIGLVYQDYNLLENTSVFRNVEIAYQLNSDTDKRQRYIEVNNILETTGLLKFATQRVSTLSGGQKQRVAIARALAKDTPIILADEPTGNLDSIAAHEIIELLHSISKDKLIIVVTHSAEQFIGKASREIILHNGEIISDKQLDSISQQTIKPHETLKTKREMINNRRKIGRLIENDIFSDIKNSISFTFITALIMLMVLLIGSIFAQFSTRSYEGVINTPVFGTIDRERLILKKENKAAFTSNELSTLKNDSSFVQVIKNDIL